MKSTFRTLTFDAEARGESGLFVLGQRFSNFVGKPLQIFTTFLKKTVLSVNRGGCYIYLFSLFFAAKSFLKKKKYDNDARLLIFNKYLNLSTKYY